MAINTGIKAVEHCVFITYALKDTASNKNQKGFLKFTKNLLVLQKTCENCNAQQYFNLQRNKRQCNNLLQNKLNKLYVDLRFETDFL